MTSLVRFNSSSSSAVAAVAALVGQDKVDQLVSHSAPVFGVFRSATPVSTSAQVKRSLTLFHGAGGSDAVTNLRFNTPLRTDRFFCDKSKNIRAFLSPDFCTALAFGTTSRILDSQDAGGEVSLQDVEKQLRLVANESLLSLPFEVKSSLVLRLDFLTEASLPVLSETGPISDDAIFLEDDDDHREQKHPCLSFFDIDHDFMNFAVLRSVDPTKIRVSTLGVVHAAVSQKRKK